MGKIPFKPGTMIYPLPAVLVGSGSVSGEYNLITIAWTGILCTNPPVCYIAVRPERHSYGLIQKYGEFTINLTTADMGRATDWCGVKSGREVDKFKECGLSPVAGETVKAPIVAESPLSLECKVRGEALELGSHHAFIADIVHIQADEKYMNPETGEFDLARADLLIYEHGRYFHTGQPIGKFGWSVKKKK